MFCSRCGAQVQQAAKFCPSCGLDLAATTPMAAVGQPIEESERDVVASALSGEYEILEELGRGGMAIVFRAREKELDREVAIKVLPFSFGFDAEFVERFQREARTAAKLEHPNIIPIYRVGRSGRVIYFVMKLLRGDALSDVLDRGGALPPQEIRRILVQTASALGYAHKHEIVHRDIKPDNIMFDESGHAILTDFGIAKAATGTRLTGTGMSIGTPHYMSPEQARAQPLDGRSDIYSLGVVAYQCLTGNVPFDGEDSFAIGYKHIMEDLPEPPFPTAQHRSLYEVIRRMLAKSPDDRFQSAGELVAVLEHGTPLAIRGAADATISAVPTTAVPRRPPLAPRPVPREVSPSTPTTPIPGAAERTYDEARNGARGLGRGRGRSIRKRTSGVLLGFIALVLVGGGGVGGYWYFFMGAQWPLPFLSGRSGSAALPDSTASDTTTTDSALALAGDSLMAAGAGARDSSSVEDSSATGPDTVTNVADLPNTGTLLVRVPQGAVLKINGRSVQRDSLDLEAGSYRVEVEQPGFMKFEEMVPVGRGDRIILPVTLLPEEEPPPRQPPPVAPRPVDVCAQEPPGPEYFAAGRCYDSAPSMARAPILTIAEVGGDVPDQELVYVKVARDGLAITVVRGPQARGDQFTLAALRFAKDSMQYSPALKDGQPIEAWLRVPVRFRRRQ